MIFTTCSHKITLFTTFNGKIGHSSFPQLINRPETYTSKAFGLFLDYFQEIGMLRTVEKPLF